MNEDLTIAELILRYLNGEWLDEGQTGQLKIWLSDPANLRKLEAQFRDPLWLAENLRVADQLDEIDHWRKFLERLAARGEILVDPRKKTDLNPWLANERWKHLAIAALIVSLLLGGYWKRLRPAHPGDPVTLTSPGRMTLPNGGPDPVPGGNRAVLRLANGSTIVLDTARNGDLASQGNTTIRKQAAGLLSWQQNMQNEKPIDNSADTGYNTITTPTGGQYQVTLPDGTRVFLNSVSSLRFPTAFTGLRKVQISGEAYFEVAKNPGHPFVVEFGDQTIDVLGTSFDVNAYPGESFSTVSLVNGSLRVGRGASQETLRPGQQAQISHGGIRVDEDTDLNQDTAWKAGRFEFHNSDIPTIMRELERWYHVSIVYEGRVPEDRFTGAMSKNLQASDVLKILALSKLHFRIEGGSGNGPDRIVVGP